METQRDELKAAEQAATEDLGGAIFAGAVIFLAGYGLYKLISNECERKLPPSGQTESSFLEKIMAQEIKP